MISAKVMLDPVTKASKGYGFVKFSAFEESQRALKEMQGKYILTKPIKLSYAPSTLSDFFRSSHMSNNPSDVNTY